MVQRRTEDRFLVTREKLEDKLAVLLGGRASEKSVYGDLSNGAADHLARADLEALFRELHAPPEAT